MPPPCQHKLGHFAVNSRTLIAQITSQINPSICYNSPAIAPPLTEFELLPLLVVDPPEFVVVVSVSAGMDADTLCGNNYKISTNN